MIDRGLERIPLLPHARRPRDKDWQTRTYTAEDIGPQAGVRCGVPIHDDQGGYLIVVDIDVKKGKIGDRSWSEFLGGRAWPDTLTVRTGSGGTHLYVRVTHPARRRVLTDVEIQGAGCLVVCSGENEYGPYAVERDLPIAWAPLWFDEWLRGESPAARGRRSEEDVASDEPVELTHALLDEYTRRIDGWLSDAIRTLRAGRQLAGPGRRHDIIRLRLIPAVLGVFGPGVTYESLCTSLLASEYPDGMSADDHARTRDAYETARRKADPTEAEDTRGAMEFTAALERAAIVQAIGEDRAAQVEDMDMEALMDGGELSLAKRLLYRREVVYSAGCWYSWAGTHWHRREGWAPVNELNTVLCADKATRAPKHRTARALNAILSLARIECSHVRMDADPYLISVQNGTLDLRTLSLRAHNPDDYISVCLPCEYVPGARHAAWDAALAEWSCGDPSWVAWLQWYCARMLIGQVTGEYIAFLSGHGANGKSAFLSVMSKLMAGHTGVIASSALAPKSAQTAHTSSIGRNIGKRLLLAQEMDCKHPVDMSAVKTYLGHTPLSAQTGMGKDFVSFTPTWTVLCDLNGLPYFQGAGPAEARRVRVLPWDAVIPEHRRDPGWAARVCAEPGMLSAVLAWLSEGLSRPEPVCARMRETTDQVLEDADPISEWWDACVQTAPGERVSRTSVWESYQSFAAMSALPKKVFYAAVRSRRVSEVKHVGIQSFVGIRLTKPQTELQKRLGKN